MTVLAVLALVLALSACRNETQNRIRRSIQEYTALKMYITVYSYDGKVLFEGEVDGKVTQAAGAEGADKGEPLGEFAFWYDDKGQYHETNLPYFVTTYDRSKLP